MCFLLYATTLFHSTASVQSRVQQLIICGHIANNTDFVFLLGNVATQEKLSGIISAKTETSFGQVVKLAGIPHF